MVNRRSRQKRSPPVKEYMKDPVKTEFTKVKDVKKSKFKKDEECAPLAEETVQARLQGIDLYEIPFDRSLTDHVFKRSLISSLYGGNLRSNFPKIGRRNVAAHGLDDFMYPTLSYNPHVPQVPGAPGLWCTIGRGENIERAQPRPRKRVITRLTKVGIWQYQGQYEFIPVDSLTKEEWQTQHPQVRNTWAQQIHSNKWGRDTRARIALRKRLGRVPTHNELSTELETKSDFKEVTPAQIAESLWKGEETMAMWAMKCVGYDADFQRSLIEEHAKKIATRTSSP
ncbi:hypothetical protein H0H93_000512, partial [Arthromyces matolae]